MKCLYQNNLFVDGFIQARDIIRILRLSIVAFLWTKRMRTAFLTSSRAIYSTWTGVLAFIEIIEALAVADTWVTLVQTVQIGHSTFSEAFVKKIIIPWKKLLRSGPGYRVKKLLTYLQSSSLVKFLFSDGFLATAKKTRRKLKFHIWWKNKFRKF